MYMYNAFAFDEYVGFILISFRYCSYYSLFEQVF
jgi:hypothetical protein